MALLGLKWWQHGFALGWVFTNIATVPGGISGPYEFLGAIFGAYLMVWMVVMFVRNFRSTNDSPEDTAAAQ